MHYWTLHSRRSICGVFPVHFPFSVRISIANYSVIIDDSWNAKLLRGTYWKRSLVICILTLIRTHFLDRFWSRRAVVAAISVSTYYVPANRVVLGLLGAGWAPHPDYLVVCFFLDLLVFSLHFLKSNRMDELGCGSWAWLLLSIESRSSFFCLTSSRN